LSGTIAYILLAISAKRGFERTKQEIETGAYSIIRGRAPFLGAQRNNSPYGHAQIRIVTMETSITPVDQRCIYRRESRVEFNRDHVIPEAFGRFMNNFVVTCVCTDCNQFFGDELELAPGRNSRESIMRLHHGLNAPAGAAKLRYDRVKLTVSQPGPWRGAQIILAVDGTGTKLDTKPVPQVALRKKDEENWTWLPEADLTLPSVLDPYRNPQSVIQVVGPSQDDVDRLTAKLKEMGIEFNERGTLLTGPPLTEPF
jgi:HNH endonuclease